MKPSVLLPTLVALTKANQPTFLWGSPGIGKSALVSQVAKAREIGFLDLRLTMLDSVDLRGVPVPKDGITHWASPVFLPTEGEGILFLDELVQAHQSVQNAASQLILDRKIGEYSLPVGWAIVAAGNRETDGAATHKMPSHLANRFTHIEVEHDLNDWIVWALDSEIRPEVVSFVKFRPELLNKFDKTMKAYPTPRAYEMANRVLGAGLPRAGLLEALKGTLGSASAEFLAFLEIYSALPDMDKILDNPAAYDVPKELSQIWSLAGALPFYITKDNVSNYFTFIKKLPQEFSVWSVMIALKKHKELLTSHKDYIAFCMGTSKILFGT